MENRPQKQAVVLIVEFKFLMNNLWNWLGKGPTPLSGGTAVATTVSGVNTKLK